MYSTKNIKILITGAKGFVAKNLIATLHNIRTGKDKTYDITEDITIYEYDLDTSESLLEAYCAECDFIYNLAGVNRPQNQDEFMRGNFEFGNTLLEMLKKAGNKCPIMLSSSIQAQLDNPYGRSKKAGEELFRTYGEENDVPVYIYRFPNIFGKWCQPNYNSVIATFCNNIANDLPIIVNDREACLELVYIDDVISNLVNLLKNNLENCPQDFCEVAPVHSVLLGDIVDLLCSFKKTREDLSIPNMKNDGFVKKLYATYLSYLPLDGFRYPLKMNVDERGSFTEIIRTQDCGQFSVNISKPGVIKGNHWHHTKNEKFVVVSGKGLIQLRNIYSDECIEYWVTGETIEVIDIPVGFTHNIINVGDTDLITFIWCNEGFDPNHPDTYFLEV